MNTDEQFIIIQLGELDKVISILNRTEMSPEVIQYNDSLKNNAKELSEIATMWKEREKKNNA